MGDRAKGTITSLDSLFSSEEALKAALRVEDAIADRRKELDRLRGFLSDNSALIHLVRKLPEDLSHDIMVPFGSAAFFPGHLIHTNEFLVLLGEGYYVDRTAKQTIEILQRRGKALEAQVDSLKAMMLDLELESKFFNSTAAEAAEGLVEIREDTWKILQRMCLNQIADLSMQFSVKAASFQSDKEQPHSIQKSPLVLKPKENLHQVSVLKSEVSSENSASQTLKIGSSSCRAFTGSIVEHSHGLAPIQSTKSTTPAQATGSNSSKPVSRFKMQKGDH